MDNITPRFSSHPIPASHSYPFSLYPVGNLRQRCFYNRGYTGDVHDVRRTSLLFILSPSWTKAIERCYWLEDLTRLEGDSCGDTDCDWLPAKFLDKRKLPGRALLGSLQRWHFHAGLLSPGTGPEQTTDWVRAAGLVSAELHRKLQYDVAHGRCCLSSFLTFHTISYRKHVQKVTSHCTQLPCLA